jgi:hypothetical protein
MSRTIFHKHHIIPRHAGGTDDHSNLIELTIEEHAEAHKKLWEEHGRWQDQIAWKALSGTIGQDDIIYRKIRPNLGKKLSEETRKKMSENNPMKCKSVSEKSAASKRGIPRSEETKTKLSIAMTGRKYSDEHRKKMSESRKQYHENRRNNQNLI